MTGRAASLRRGYRRVETADLRPDRELRALAGPGRFESLGHDPSFAPIPVRFGRWIRLRLQMKCEWDAVHHPAELYYDIGQGFNPGHRLIVAADRARPLDLTRRAPGRVRAIWLHPTSTAGEFTLEELDLSSPSTMAVYARATWSKLLRIARSERPLAELLAMLGRLARYALLLDRRGLEIAVQHNVADNLRSLASDNAARYREWLEGNELGDAGRQAMRAHVERMVRPPRFSVLMPVCDPPERYLRHAIESVLGQLYPHWELCIADDGSTRGHVRTVLEEYARRDPRVRVHYRGERGGISAASNDALGLATGDWAALLDHDDELAEHALYACAAAVERDPAIDMIYSDEDKIDERGRRSDPFFKPDWSPEYFLSCMYTCHLGAYRLPLLREIGGFRSELDGAQDYDLVLRLSERTTKIHHIPDVLYHWRTLATSTASGATAKPQAHRTAQRALAAHLERQGTEGRVEDGPATGYHHVRFALARRPPISIVIVSALNRTVIRGEETWWPLHCIRSVRERSTYDDPEILLVHQRRPPAELTEALRPFDVRPVLYPSRPFNWSDSNNHGAGLARGEYLLFLNDDMEVLTPDWLECLLEHAQRPGVGAAGAKLLFPDGSLQHVGVALSGGAPSHPFYRFAASHPGYFNSNLVIRNCVAVTGSCLMTPAALFRDLGGFDTDLAIYYQDVDYGLKVLAAGRRVVFTPHARLIHHENVSIPPDRERLLEELGRFGAKWTRRGETFVHDPYYNPNFSHLDHNCSIEPRRRPHREHAGAAGVSRDDPPAPGERAAALSGAASGGRNRE